MSCPDWGPRDDHHFHSEDSDRHTGVCSCGAVEKPWSDEDHDIMADLAEVAVKRPDYGDPPF